MKWAKLLQTATSTTKLTHPIRLSHFTRFARLSLKMRLASLGAAFKGLCQYVKFEETKKRIEKLSQRNYNQVYYLNSRKEIAFEGLVKSAQEALLSYAQTIQHVEWLHATALRASTYYLRCIEAVEFLAVTASRALVFSERRDKDYGKLVRRGKKYKKLNDARVKNVNYFSQRSERAKGFVIKKNDDYRLLAVRGESSMVYTVKYEEAIEFLLNRGYESKNFEQMVKEVSERSAASERSGKPSAAEKGVSGVSPDTILTDFTPQKLHYKFFTHSFILLGAGEGILDA